MPPHFRNAQQLARLHPDSFQVPTAEQLERVGPGSWVKVSVAFPENGEGMDGERFWVKVAERRGNRVIGRIDNELFATRDHGLARDDQVEFSLEHVYEIATRAANDAQQARSFPGYPRTLIQPGKSAKS
jgi:hypothetical protein